MIDRSAAVAAFRHDMNEALKEMPLVGRKVYPTSQLERWTQDARGRIGYDYSQVDDHMLDEMERLAEAECAAYRGNLYKFALTRTGLQAIREEKGVRRNG